MTDDLVKRLRWSADGWDDCDNPENAQQDREAADRIEKLEQALLDIFDHECMTSATSFIACTARDNLWPKKEEAK